MIFLTRIRTAAAIKAIYRGADKKVKDKELLVSQRAYLQDALRPVIFKTTYWKQAKSQLKKESFGKCAYCEAPSSVVAYCDVEHYRPKSIYWWLAYTYDNYLYACQICNQDYKGDNFPITGRMLSAPALTAHTDDPVITGLLGFISPDPIDTHIGYTLDDLTLAHKAERPSLLNPYFDRPEKIIAYQEDDIKEEVAVVAVNAAAQHYIKAMEDFYGINRIELKNFRYQIFTKFRVLKKVYSKVHDKAVTPPKSRTA